MKTEESTVSIPSTSSSPSSSTTGGFGFCLFCGFKLEATSDDPWFALETTKTCTERMLSEVIEDMLEEDAIEENVHSSLCCKKCFEIVEDMENTQLKYDQLRNKLVVAYRDTYAKINNDSNELEDRNGEESIEDDKENQMPGNQFLHLVQQGSETIRLEEILEESNSASVTSNDGALLGNATMHNIEQKLIRIHGGDSSQQIISAVDQNGSSIVLNSLEELQQFNYVITENCAVIQQQQQRGSEQAYEQMVEDATTDDDIGNNPGIVLHAGSTSEGLLSGKITTKIENNDIEQIIKPSILRKKEVMEQSKSNLMKKIKTEIVAPIVAREENMYICLLCPEELPFKEEAKPIIAHLRDVHNERLYICDVCGQHFRKRNELSSHIDDHVANEDGDFQCETCNRIYNNLRLFRVHKRSHQPQNKSWICKVCSKCYSSKNLLEEHMNIHTGNRPYRCSICNKDFASKYTYRAHEKTHGNRPRPYECQVCQKSFLSQQNLTQHERIHTDVKEYACDHCPKRFGSAHNLEVHLVVHTGHKAFKCKICHKAFARKAEIRDHERTHTGERPYQCEMCGSTFSQRSNLQSHKRATHYDDKRYKCTTCDKGFKRRRLLDYHIKAVHTGERPYKCDVCSSTFVYPEHFKKHTRIHTGEKPFTCEICGKAFNSRDNRNSHRYVHSDKKPYECVKCGSGFMRKPHLYQHMRTSGHLHDTIVVNQPHVKEANQSEIVTTDECIEFLPTTTRVSYDSLTEGLQEAISSDGTKVYIADVLDSDEGTLVNLEEAEMSQGGEVSHIIINGDELQYVESEEMELDGEEQQVYVDGQQVLCIDSSDLRQFINVADAEGEDVTRFLPEIVEVNDEAEGYQYIEVKVANSGNDEDKQSWVKIPHSEP